MDGTRKNGGNGAGPRDLRGDGEEPYEPLIRDRDDEFFEDWDRPRAGYDPYGEFSSGGFAGGAAGDRNLVDAIARIIDSMAALAGDALSPQTRRQVESVLRDLLVVLRDVINAMIERIDGRREDDFKIEEIPID